MSRQLLQEEFCPKQISIMYSPEMGLIHGFNERLVRARERAGYEKGSQAIAAFGYKRSTYYQHEDGRRTPELETAERYAKNYRVDLKWLLFGEGDPRSSDAIDWDLLLAVLTQDRITEIEANPANAGERSDAIETAAFQMSLALKDAYEVCEKLQITADNLPGIRAALLNARPTPDSEQLA